MVGKRIEIHPAALAELKSAVEWYLERSEPAAREFVAEVDRAIALVIESPRRWPLAGLRAQHAQICFAAVSFRGHLPRKGFGRANLGARSRTTDDLGTGRNGCSGQDCLVGRSKVGVPSGRRNYCLLEGCACDHF